MHFESSSCFESIFLRGQRFAGVRPTGQCEKPARGRIHLGEIGRTIPEHTAERVQKTQLE
jgi:hypothetical protein